MKLSIKNLVLSIKGGILLIVFLLNTFYFLPTTYAIEASQSSELIQQKLDELKSQIASKAAKIKEEINKRLQNRIVLGPVTSIEDKKINITTQDLDRVIITNEYTLFSKGTIKKPTLTDIKKDDYIIGLGEIDDKNNLVAKKVVVTAPPLNNKQFLFGEIQEIATNSMKLKQLDGSEKTLQFSKPTLTSGEGSLTLKDLKPGYSVGAVILLEKESLNLRYLYVINRKIKLQKSASPSAKIASPSAKPK